MEGWTDGLTHGRIQDFLSGEGGGVQDGRPEYRICTWDQYLPTYLPTYLCMNRQAHECLRTGRRIDIQHVDGKLKDIQINRTHA